jgi:hypothetical protein
MKTAFLSVVCAVIAIGWIATAEPSAAIGSGTVAVAARHQGALVPGVPPGRYLDPTTSTSTTSTSTASPGPVTASAQVAAGTTGGAVTTTARRPASTSHPTTSRPSTRYPTTSHPSTRHPDTSHPNTRHRSLPDLPTTTSQTTATATTRSPTTAPSASLPASAAPSGWGCGAAIAYLRAHAAPGFSFECPGSALGHQAMTCIDVPGVCPGEKLISISVPCPAAYMNEASNSYALQHLSDAPIDPYGYCHS